MLDITLSTTITDRLWNRLETRALLPCDEELFLAETGFDSLRDHCSRRFRRINMRGRAAVRLTDRFIGVYTVDISPQGVGFISPMQIFPKTEVRLLFEEHPGIDLVVRRCRRLGKCSYSCGGDFKSGAMSPSCYKRLLQSLRNR